MGAKHMPPGTQAAILRAVVHEKHPKMMLGQIAQPSGAPHETARHVTAHHASPDNAKRRTAAAALELEDQGQMSPRPAVNPFDPDQTAAEKVTEKLGGDSGE